MQCLFSVRIFSFGGDIGFQELQRKEERRREEKDKIVKHGQWSHAFCFFSVSVLYYQGSIKLFGVMIIVSLCDSSNTTFQCTVSTKASRQTVQYKASTVQSHLGCVS